MLYCPNCGQQVSSEMKYCTNCGTKLEKESASASGIKINLDDSAVYGNKISSANKRKLFYILLAAAIVLFSITAVIFYTGRSTSSPEDLKNDFSFFNAAFIISEYNSSTTSYSIDSLKKSGFDDWYIAFSDNGTGSMYILENDPIGFTYKENILYLSGGKRCTYTLNVEQLTLEYSDDIKLIFSKSDSPVLRPMETPEPSKEISVKDYIGSTWYGTLNISNTKGDLSNVIKDGKIDVLANLDTDDAGNTFFEVYYANDYDADPILSMWVKVYDDCFKADIGELDSWYFDMYLISSENKSFIFRPDNGKISHTYYYDSGSTSCKIVLQLEYLE